MSSLSVRGRVCIDVTIVSSGGKWTDVELDEFDDRRLLWLLHDEEDEEDDDVLILIKFISLDGP